MEISSVKDIEKAEQGRSGMILPNWLMRCAENIPQHLAIRCGEISWTFAELEQQTIHLTHQLAALGIGEKSRVTVLSSSGLPYITCVHALMRLGAILIPLNTRLTQAELCWQIQDIQATHIIGDETYRAQILSIHEQLPELPHEIITLDPETKNIQLDHPEVARNITLKTLLNLDDIQAILYTSGTTGTPKGVVITYGMQWWNALGSALNLGHHTDDCWLACMPLFHVGGLNILIRSVINGISIIIMEKFDADAVNTSIREEHVTIISVVAVMLQRMVTALDKKQQTYPPTLRCVLLGGGPAPQPLLEDCIQRHIPVIQTYGLTESCSQAVTLAPGDVARKLGSAGRPLAHIQIHIANEGKIARAEEPGVIYLKGPSITSGYDHQPEITAQTIQDGWLATGDIGYLDTEGYLYVLDRRSDLIISGGENVYPAEIEAVLLSHPAVQEAGVCGQPDAQWGQIPIAFVCLHDDQVVTMEDLQTFAKKQLAHYKLPRKIYQVKQLPRNAAGKLLRRNLPALLPTSKQEKAEKSV